MSYGRRRRFYRSLSFRLNAWHALVFLLIFGLAALGARLFATRSIDDAQALLVQTEIEQHRQRIERGGIEGLSQFATARREHVTARWFVRVSDAGGHTLLFDAPEASLQFDSADLVPARGLHTIHARPTGSAESAGEPWRIASTLVIHQLWLQVGVTDRPRLQQRAQVERWFWLLLGLGLTLGALGGWLVTRRELKPLRALAETSRHIIERGDLSARVEVPQSDDELHELSVLFNRMLERNQVLVEGMRQALDNVAHDLRTPLSSLRSSAELALQHERDEAALRDALADCIEDSERVLRMLHTLMDISEAETGVMKLSLEPVSLNALAQEALDVYQPLAEQQGVRLHYDAPTEVWVQGDRQRLTQAIANLVDNAIKYTDRGGMVTLAISRERDRAQLRVRDTGVGIAAVHLDKIWQRLYRADPSRSRRGLGLGLSFVKAIVEAHGGHALATSVLGQGSTFELSLPALQSRA